MPETVEVEELPLVVSLSQEIALAPPHRFLGVPLGGLQPGLPGVGHVGSEHRCDVGPRRHAKHGRLGGFRGDMGAKQHGQGRLDELPGVLAVLGRAGLAGDERLVAVQEQPPSREAPQFGRPQSRLDGHGVKQHPLLGWHLVPLHAFGKRGSNPLPFLGKEHATFPPPICLGIGPLHGGQRITRQFVVGRQPLGETLDRGQVRLDSPGGPPLVLQLPCVLVDAVRSDVGHLLELPVLADGADVGDRRADMLRSPIGRPHLGFVVLHMRFDGPTGLLADRVEFWIDHAVSA